MSQNLYKVIVKTEIMVMAKDEFEALTTAKQYAPNEIEQFGDGNAKLITKISDIPESWQSIVPYSSGGQETKNCQQIMKDIEKEKILLQIPPKPNPKPSDIVLIVEQTTTTTTLKKIPSVPSVPPSPPSPPIPQAGRVNRKIGLSVSNDMKLDKIFP